MNRNNNARTKNIANDGNILNSFLKYKSLIPRNDGTRKFLIRQQDANASLPVSDSTQQTDLKLTHDSIQITQFDDSHQLIKSTVQLTAEGLSDDDFAGDSPVLFAGFKASSQIFQEIIVLHNGIETDYKSQECQREHFAYTNYKGRIEKTNKKHTYSLYPDVQKYLPGVCGVYIPTSAFKNVNKTATIQLISIIPNDMLLPFQSFEDILRDVGEIGIRAKFGFGSLIYCQVDPQAVLESTNYLNDTHNTLDTHFADTHYDHFFTQIGDYARILDQNSTDPTYSTRRVRLSVSSFSVNYWSTTIHGYGAQEPTINQIRQELQANPFLFPTQELVQKPFTGQIDGNAFDSSLSYVPKNVHAISIMFPTSPNQRSIFRNPNIKNVEFYVDNELVTPQKYSTNSNIDPEFIQTQLNVAELDGTLEPTQSFINSIAEPRTNSSGVRYNNSRSDDTDFMLTYSFERNQSGNVFDGLTKDSPTDFRLKFEPVATGNNDVYYIPDPAAPTIHSPAPHLWICRDTFWSMGLNHLQYHRTQDP